MFEISIQIPSSRDVSSPNRNSRALRFLLDRQRTRWALRQIVDDPRRLRDVGLTAEQARREAAKWFWME